MVIPVSAANTRAAPRPLASPAWEMIRQANAERKRTADARGGQRLTEQAAPPSVIRNGAMPRATG